MNARQNAGKQAIGQIGPRTSDLRLRTSEIPTGGL